MSTFHSIWTVVLLIAFIAIVGWAYSRRRRDSFERAARSVLEDETTPADRVRGDHRRERNNG